ncbi:hypothetical protein KZ810_13195 [Sphingomonas sp. RHCKR47]|nr:hypothetical protein [Sphingomonas citricola]
MRALLPRLSVMRWCGASDSLSVSDAEGRVINFSWGRLVIEFAIGVREIC